MLLDRSHREFFWLLVRRDLKVRYAGSTLGAVWNLIHPLMMIAIYMTIFSTLMRTRGGPTGDSLYGDLKYGVHLCAGLIPWLMFSDVLMRSTSVLIENSNFLQKVSFPPLVLFASVFFNAYIINGAGYLCFLGILLLLGKGVPLVALAGLGIMILFGLTALGLGLILAGLNVFFRDTLQILTIAMQFLFWFNPVVYFMEVLIDPKRPKNELMLLERLGQWILTVNPFARFITTTQSLFGFPGFTGPAGQYDSLIVLGFPILCLVAGLYCFRRMLPDIRDCL